MDKHTFRRTLLAVRLHGDMGVQVVQSTICLFATIPSTLVHTLDLFVSTARTLMLLSTGNRDEGVDLRERMLLTISGSIKVVNVCNFLKIRVRDFSTNLLDLNAYLRWRSWRSSVTHPYVSRPLILGSSIVWKSPNTRLMHIRWMHMWQRWGNRIGSRNCRSCFWW